MAGDETVVAWPLALLPVIPVAMLAATARSAEPERPSVRITGEARRGEALGGANGLARSGKDQPRSGAPVGSSGRSSRISVS